MCLGEALPTGDSSDAGLERLEAAIEAVGAGANACDAKLQQASLDEVVKSLDHTQNPGAYRLCQDAALDHALVPCLLGLTRVGTTDSLRCRSMEALCRIVFGNPKAAASVAGDDGFELAVESALQGAVPIQLAGLQLAQAVFASAPPGSLSCMPAMSIALEGLTSQTRFPVLSQVALEVCVSASFHDPEGVAAVLPRGLLASLLIEGEGRPMWWPLDPVQVLATGFLATNVLSLSGVGDDDSAASVIELLQGGSFVDSYLFAIEAAASRSEWPVGSCTFHSSARLLLIAKRLVSFGYHRRLVGAVPHLASIAESAPDKATSDMALSLLKDLGRDVECLDVLLSLTTFRQGALQAMCEFDGVPEAVELASFLLTTEDMYEAAEEILEESRQLMPNAPSVRCLADLFSGVAPLDGEAESEALFRAMLSIPVGPIAALRASVSNGSQKSFNFQEFARRFYGTPTILGWWPSLMEDIAGSWKDAESTLGSVSVVLPSLAEVASLFEQSALGKSTACAASLLSDAQAALGLPVDSVAVETAFATMQETSSFSFDEFAQWLAELYAELAREERERKEEEKEACGAA